MKGKRIRIDGKLNDALLAVLTTLVDRGGIDAVVVPSRIPSGESFAHLLVKDRKLLESTTPLPPVMPVQGARALQSFTRQGKAVLKVLGVMRPCEVRAAVELAKLKQVDLENVLLLSVDCPGAFPTRDYIQDPAAFDRRYEKITAGGAGEGLRPDCQTCVRFSHQDLASDIHIGVAGHDEIVLVGLTEAGGQLLVASGMVGDEDVAVWQAAVKEKTKQRAAVREKAFAELKCESTGTDRFEHLLADCINCHNCMRVCPICYCRQCFFDSGDSIRLRADDYFARAEDRGGIRFPGEMMQFHLGRMYHMALSCVGCGVCEDGCPVNVPVGQVFALVGAEVQAAFDYVPGRDRQESTPMRTYREDELHDFEDNGGTE